MRCADGCGLDLPAFSPLAIAAFAYYNDPGDTGFEASPSYLIIRSNIEGLPLWGNVDAETLNKHGVEIPMTPTYRTWLAMGKPCTRRSDFEKSVPPQVFK